MFFLLVEQTFDMHNCQQKNANTNGPQFMECWICFKTYFSKYVKTHSSRITFASTVGHFGEFLSLPFMINVMIFFFSTQFHMYIFSSRYVHFIRLVLLFTCKKRMRFLNSNGSRCKNRSSNFFFSTGIQNKPVCSNVHFYGYHKCYFEKTENLKR